MKYIIRSEIINWVCTISVLDKLVIKYGVFIEYGGRIIIDPYFARVLETLRDMKSLYKAAKSVGISYSSLWEQISRVERILGTKIIATKKGGRGGGYTTLTEFGEKILEMYTIARRDLERRLGSSLIYREVSEKPDIVIAYSDDPLLISILNDISSKYSIKGMCIGSGLSLAMISLGEVDVACSHLYDPSTDTYNTPYLERFWVKDLVVSIGGFLRMQVLVYREGLDIGDLEINEIIDRILEGQYIVAMRNRGSGTRVFFEYLLRKRAELLRKSITDVKGFESQYSTYEEIARSLIDGRADISMMPMHIATQYKLPHKSIALERYECFARKEELGREPIKLLSKALKNSIEYIQKYRFKGYYPLES